VRVKNLSAYPAGSTVFIGGIALIITAILCFGVGNSDVLGSQDRAVAAAEAAGLRDVEPLGYNIFSCSEDDVFGVNVRGQNSAGTPVEATVCCGLIKGCTVRY
jgi:hypothetical protein